VDGRMKDSELGFALCFHILNRSSFYGEVVAKVVIDALRQANFSGRCEYYAADAFVQAEAPIYIVALGLNLVGIGDALGFAWWNQFARQVAVLLPKDEPDVELDPKQALYIN
jgi:hypothetical protein